MKKTFYYNFLLPTKADEEARALVEIRDLYPTPQIDPNNPWHIRKIITTGEVATGKLMISHNDAFDHVFRYWSLDMANYVVMGNKLPVAIWDLTDDNNPARYCNENIFFEKGSRESYVLGWMDLVRNRLLNSGDEIGLYWEIRSSTFQFKLLRQGI